VIAAAITALFAVPGAPGNDDRRRANQALPLLVVFAVRLLAPAARSPAGR
jgi:hypothetical protein